MNLPGVIRVLLGWVVAVVITVLLGAIVQTQFNLSRLAALGAEVGLGARLTATGHDLIYFTPVFAILVSVAFAVAWPIAALLKRFLPAHRGLLFSLAGGSSIWVMLVVMNQTLPVTAIAASRSLAGSLSLVAVGLLAGLIYSRIIKEDSNAKI
ncbi:MAG: hypothetical protein ACNA7E_10260 [Wenzhouxiangellaceae bacterium]